MSAVTKCAGCPPSRFVLILARSKIIGDPASLQLTTLSQHSSLESMSKRELTALLADNPIGIISSTRSGRSRTMEDGFSDRQRLAQLEAKVADLQEVVTCKDQELQSLCEQAENQTATAQNEVEHNALALKAVEKELQDSRLCTDLREMSTPECTNR